MTRLLSDAKNLLEALEIKKSGYATKIHASPHKKEVDLWIMDFHWSSRHIVNELKRLYPNENHPSDRGIDNYRNKYLPKEFARGTRMTKYSEEIREKLIKEFDPAVEAKELWVKTRNALDVAMKVMEKTSVPPKFLIDLLKVCGENLVKCYEIYKSLGLVSNVPTEISITEKRVYDPEELKSRFNKLLEITRQLEGINKEGVGTVEGTNVGGESGNDKPVVEVKVS
jgi:hypothetical protein